MGISKARAFLLPAVFVLIAGCRRETVSAAPEANHWSPAELLGCYEILDAKRRPADSVWYNVMPTVRLTDTPMRRYKDTVRARAWHLLPLSNAGQGRWRADPEGKLESVVGFAPEWSLNASGDTLRFNFIDGFSGATIQFARADTHGDTLRGVVTEHWDFGPPFSNDKGRAYAVRRSCP